MPHSAEERTQAKDVILKAVQKAVFAKELLTLRANKTGSRISPLLKLNPILEDGLICVGGWLKHSVLSSAEKDPIILPKDNHVPLLLMRHHHELVKHKGHPLTEGAVMDKFITMIHLLVL